MRGETLEEWCRKNNPSLLDEWDYVKNQNVSPETISASTTDKVWWICKQCGKGWETGVRQRTKCNHGCPICCRKKVSDTKISRAASNGNNLSAKFPDISKEWDYAKNGDLTPEMVAGKSHVVVWWICKKCSFSYRSSVANRTNLGRGCPNCARQSVSTKCYERSIKGGRSLAELRPDIASEWDYEKNGEITPDKVSIHSNREVWWICKKCGYEWRATIDYRTRGVGCIQCSKAERERKAVLKQIEKVAKKQELKKNRSSLHRSIKPKYDLEEFSISSKAPELMNEWDNEKNAPLTPDNILVVSRDKVWWKCHICGKEWQATPYSRFENKTSCPSCTAKNRAVVFTKKNIESGFNIAVKKPEIAQEWDYEKNKPLTPNDVAPSSKQLFWWKCHICGKEWQATPSIRKKPGCRQCLRKIQTKKQHDKKIQTGNLLITYPELCEEWDCEKNGELTPKDILPTDHDILVWWKCKTCNNSWTASCFSRARKGTGCPECYNKTLSDRVHQYALKNGNTIRNKSKNLLNEWDYEKNGELTPDDVTPGSNQLIWWRCKICGYSYQASPYNRKNGVGCPHCNATLHTSFSEKALLYYISEITDAIGGFHPPFMPKSELDIFIPSIKCAVEYDGRRWHKRNFGKDCQKTKLCNDNGIELIRVRETGLPPIPNCYNITVDPNDSNTLDDAIIEIIDYISQKLGVEKQINVDLKRDSPKIESLKEKVKRDTSLAVKYPTIAKEWDYERNYPLQPKNVSYMTSLLVWWKCPSCGNVWDAPVQSRTNMKSGCPYCGKRVARVIPGFNDLATTNPELVNEWNYERNGDLTPELVSRGSKKKVWWRCEKGHEWEAYIHARSRTKQSSSCPYCSGNKVLQGFNDLATTNPELVKEWNYERNGDLTPYNISKGCNKKIWWKCDKGHEWQAIVTNRVKGFGKCPKCAYNRDDKKQ